MYFVENKLNDDRERAQYFFLLLDETQKSKHTELIKNWKDWEWKHGYLRYCDNDKTFYANDYCLDMVIVNLAIFDETDLSNIDGVDWDIVESTEIKKK